MRLYLVSITNNLHLVYLFLQLIAARGIQLDTQLLKRVDEEHLDLEEESANHYH